jgi:hypothetical protein
MSQFPLSSQLDAERTAILDRAAASVLAVETQRVRQSAFVWRGGLIVTAAEPLEGAESVRILKEGSAGDAEVLACDLRTDIAVMRCAETIGPPLAPAAASPRAGQTLVLAGRAGRDLTASWGSIHLSAGPWTTRRHAFAPAAARCTAGTHGRRRSGPRPRRCRPGDGGARSSRPGHRYSHRCDRGRGQRCGRARTHRTRLSRGEGRPDRARPAGATPSQRRSCGAGGRRRRAAFSSVRCGAGNRGPAARHRRRCRAGARSIARTHPRQAAR